MNPVTNLQPDWVKRVEMEAVKFASVVEHNFKNGLNQSLPCLPDSKNVEHRRTQLDTFLSALIGATVKCVVVTYNSSQVMEDHVVQIFREKFAFVRDYQEKLEKEKVENK